MIQPLIIAHRGAPGQLENTVEGFLDGVARGAEWVELDVHRTADGALAVLHDAVLGGKPLARLELRQARELAERLRHIQLPTLEQVIAALPRSVGLNVEIKATGIGPAVVAALADQGAIERTICSSFHYPTIREMAELRTLVRTGILADSPLPDAVAEIRQARAQALFLKHTLASHALVTEVKKAGFQVFVWTVNSEADLKSMLELGVDGIITDFPDRLAGLLGKKSKNP